MKGNGNVYQGAFLSRGGDGYTAPPRKPNIEDVIRQMYVCRSELMRNTAILQQAALEQERTEQRFEGLAQAVTLLIEVAKKPVAESVVTEDWIKERDQVIMGLQKALGEAQSNE
jgi:hypothetical protein